MRSGHLKKFIFKSYRPFFLPEHFSYGFYCKYMFTMIFCIYFVILFYILF